MNPFGQDWDDLFYPIRDPSPRRIAEFARHLRDHRNDFVTLYHGTDASHPVLAKGLLPTTATRRRSYQSSSGYVYLSVYPGSAQNFGELAYPGRPIQVYRVTLCIFRLRCDKDQLANQRAHAGRTHLKDTLANSLIFGHGARVKGKITPMSLSLYEPPNLHCNGCTAPVPCGCGGEG